ncbi:MAG: hypothetical protein OEY35_02635, partial [Gammaproteobacteria bacterium]|nr:hypothetical protein [Gammaproteobacteria bacterium]
MVSGLLNFVKRRDISKYHVVIMVTTVLLVSLYWKYNHNIEVLKEKFIALSTSENHQTVDSIRHQFRVIEQGLRTISRLPEIKRISHHNPHLSKETTITVNEIYSSLTENVAVSEIYITLVNNKLKKGELERPILEFDNNILENEHNNDNEDEE